MISSVQYGFVEKGEGCLYKPGCSVSSACFSALSFFACALAFRLWVIFEHVLQERM
jgi:hypothetical protein